MLVMLRAVVAADIKGGNGVGIPPPPYIISKLPLTDTVLLLNAWREFNLEAFNKPLAISIQFILDLISRPLQAECC